MPSRTLPWKILFILFFIKIYLPQSDVSLSPFFIFYFPFFLFPFIFLISNIYNPLLRSLFPLPLSLLTPSSVTSFSLSLQILHLGRSDFLGKSQFPRKLTFLLEDSKSPNRVPSLKTQGIYCSEFFFCVFLKRALFGFSSQKHVFDIENLIDLICTMTLGVLLFVISFIEVSMSCLFYSIVL